MIQYFSYELQYNHENRARTPITISCEQKLLLNAQCGPSPCDNICGCPRHRGRRSARRSGAHWIKTSFIFQKFLLAASSQVHISIYIVESFKAKILELVTISRDRHTDIPLLQCRYDIL